MASICEKCGKKVGAFSPTPLKLVYDQILCYECAEIISADITKLYGAKTIEDFNKIKDIIKTKWSAYNQFMNCLKITKNYTINSKTNQENKRKNTWQEITENIKQKYLQI